MWSRLFLGNLLFALLPAVFMALAVPAGLLAFFVESSRPDPYSRGLQYPALLSIAGLEVSPTRLFVADGVFVTDQHLGAAPYQASTEAVGSRSGALEVTAEVGPSRLVVVDADSEIIGIWSNTGRQQSSSYSLMVRRGSLNGEVQPLTEAVLSEYIEILPEVDWRIRGRVYPPQTGG